MTILCIDCSQKEECKQREKHGMNDLCTIMREEQKQKPVTDQSSATQPDQLTPELMQAGWTYQNIQTDKTRKESAEREIVQILERLNGQLEMRIAGVVVDSRSNFDGKTDYSSKVTILLK